MKLSVALDAHLTSNGVGEIVAAPMDVHLSPSSIETDFLRTSKLYERFGVKEYWIVNPEGETVSVQTLEGDRFLLTGEYGRDDRLHSTVLDRFELELATIFPRTAGESDSTKESQAIDDE